MYVILTSKPGQFTTEIGADLEPVETFDYIFCGRKRAQFVIARLLRDTKVKIVDASVPPVVNLVPSKFLPGFDTIEKASTQALAEMRRLLGLLREDDEQLALAPLPSLALLEALAEQMRTSGLPVEIERVGDPVELPPGVDLSASRIVQEALTNALKHAGPARARVVVRFGADDLELETLDDGPGGTNGDGAGHGLIGIHERVAVVGGEVQAGPRVEGGFAVRARLPYSNER